LDSYNATMLGSSSIQALIAVDDAVALGALNTFFAVRGDKCELVSAKASLRGLIGRLHPNLLVLQVSGNAELLDNLKQEFPDLPIVILTHGEPEIAFRAARSGALELLTLPLEVPVMTSRLGRVVSRLVQDPINNGIDMGNGKTPNRYEEALNEFPNLFNSTPRMREIRDTIDKVATTSATVLIRGESGVGKEIVARMIYARSQRSAKSFVKVNCAAIPNDLLESELFGYEQGAFTGATRSKPGKFELAHGGTLFLDEIGEMHPALQAKLLHVLQDGEFSRLGAKQDIAVDVRVICATNKILEQRVADGLFREDLLFRINVVTIHVPPLRERRDGIPVLIDYFLRKYSGVYHRKVAPLSDEVMRFLAQYSWPGNIRELENLCKRYVIVGDATQIVRELSARTAERANNHARPSEESAAQATAATQHMSLLKIGRQAAWEAEKEAIRETLASTRWNRKEAARRLQVSYKALLNKIRQMEEENEIGRQNAL
jgi:two-component system, NtrC family, response regulator AtoC